MDNSQYIIGKDFLIQQDGKPIKLMATMPSSVIESEASAP